MIALIYRYTGDATRSIVRATMVAEIEIDEEPEDDIEFAQEYGGHFLEIVNG